MLFPRSLTIGVDVDLGKDSFSFVLFGEFFKMGCDLTAGTAAIGIVVDDDGQTRFSFVVLLLFVGGGRTYRRVRKKKNGQNECFCVCEFLVNNVNGIVFEL